MQKSLFPHAFLHFSTIDNAALHRLLSFNAADKTSSLNCGPNGCQLGDVRLPYAGRTSPNCKTKFRLVQMKIMNGA